MGRVFKGIVYYIYTFFRRIGGMVIPPEYIWKQTSSVLLAGEFSVLWHRLGEAVAPPIISRPKTTPSPLTENLCISTTRGSLEQTTTSNF